MILPPQTIKRLGILSPCYPRTRFRGVTYGLSSNCYDLCLDLSRRDGRLPKRALWIWPLFPRMADAVEYFKMPNDIAGELFTKSTWARAPNHVRIGNTIIDAGWCGFLRLEISVHRLLPIRIPHGVGIAHVVFHRLEEPTDQPYEGKYQNQGLNQNAIFEAAT